MRRFRGCQLSCHLLKRPNIYEDVIDASVNTCCKLKLVFLEKRQDSLVFGQTVFRNQMGILYQILWCMSQTNRHRNNSSRVRTHEKNSGETVRRLGTIIQSIFCAQSGAGIRLNFWKQLDESRYPGTLSPVLENFRPALSPDRTNCPWVSKDDPTPARRVTPPRNVYMAKFDLD